MAHRHAAVEEPMSAVDDRRIDDRRIDNLRVRQFSCGCGFAAAVLSRVEGEEPGLSWPYTLQPSTRFI